MGTGNLIILIAFLLEQNQEIKKENQDLKGRFCKPFI